MVYPHRWNYRCSEVLYTYSAWGFGVARFYYGWHVERPQNVERATESGFTSFLFYNGYKESIAYYVCLFMDKEKNYLYESPQVEIIEVEVEKGFATSSGIGTEGLDGEQPL